MKLVDSRYADTAGRAVLETLRAYGIETIFGIPGTHNLELYRPLSDLGIRAVTTRHEQGAEYAADGWAQQTGLPGVVITTSGPGLQNAMSAVGTAFCESRPMIVLSPGAAIGDEFADRGTLHETKNSTAMAGAVAEWSRRVRSASEAVEAVQSFHAVPNRAAAAGPYRDSAGRARVSRRRAGVGAEARPTAAEAGADSDALARAARIIEAARNPVIITGGGATRAAAEVTALAERLGAPVLSTLNGKGTLDERHELSLGASLRLPAAHAVAEASDVLIVLGSKLGDAELWVPELLPRGRVVRVDISASQLQKNLAADVAIRGDVAVVVSGLLPMVTDRGGAWPDLDAARVEIAAQIALALPSTVELGAQIVAALPDNTIVAGDSSQIVYLAVANQLRQARPHSMLYTPTYATLGYGLPAAIGARIADPRRPVVAVIGDGALMFCVNELMTAVEQRLDLTVVCVDNGGYAEIKQNEQDRGIPPIGVDLVQPDWAMLAAAFGATGTSVSQGPDVGAAIRAAVKTGGVQLVHIRQTA